MCSLCYALKKKHVRYQVYCVENLLGQFDSLKPAYTAIKPDPQGKQDRHMIGALRRQNGLHILQNMCL